MAVLNKEEAVDRASKAAQDRDHWQLMDWGKRRFAGGIIFGSQSVRPCRLRGSMDIER
jgi:hypothetical protein